MNIIITGASKGIGKEIATIFANNNNTLLLCSRNESDLEALSTELKQQQNCKILYKAVDVSKKEECISFSNWCKKQVANIDVLVNNAGQYLPGSIYNEADGILEKMLTTNLLSAYYITRGVIDVMIGQKSGIVFNICSIASINAYPNGGSYSISKFAMYGFSKNLREELKPFGIKVCSVLPGAVYTNSWSGSGIDPARIMEADDVAKMVYATAHLSKQAVVEDLVLRPQLGDV